MTRATRIGQLERREAVRELLKDRGEALVITGLGSPTYDVFAAGDSDANMYLWGAMGGAAIMGLGLAIAQPRRPVIVVTGDGEQLMGVGGLITIATKRPGNLSVVVLDNGHYGETGQQASHTGLGVDLGRVAEAAGLESVELTSLEAIAGCRPHLQRLDGAPRLFVVRISADAPPRALPARDGVYLKTRFRQNLGLSVN
jgi:thiamine pyrophosphate-dependent acetolactate synthase large subunit-like protein